MQCPLCQHNDSESFNGMDQILFWKCPHCFLIYKDVSFYLTAEEEQHRYRQHNNTPDCAGYVDFLNQAITPTLPHLEAEMAGMDFGCGPNPVLAGLLKQSGMECYPYDPFFFPELPDERLDFIFSTECFEHFSNPSKEISLITSLLIPSGLLTIMTHRWSDDTDLLTWWYMRDQTHVCFFHDKTFQYICIRFGYEVEFDDGEKVIILRKCVVWEN